jgi:hypothetical protein
MYGHFVEKRGMFSDEGKTGWVEKRCVGLKKGAIFGKTKYMV